MCPGANCLWVELAYLVWVIVSVSVRFSMMLKGAEA